MADSTFSSHIPALLGSIAGTIAATIAGSYLGSVGTYTGLAAGALITGTGSWWAERWVRRATALTRAKARAVRERGGRPLTPHETQIITAIVDSKHRRRFTWQPAAAGAGVALAVSMALFGGWWAVAGRPVSEIVRPPPAVTRRPAPADTVTVEVTPTPTPATSSPTLLPSPTASTAASSPATSPSPSPTDSTATAPPSPSPTFTLAPGSS